MKSQHQVVLSIGSNQGNRLENIKSCINLIHQEVGTVIRVSKLYETPAWGFESDAFYNCALLLHTTSSAQKILSQVLKVEKQLGRIRLNQEGYQSRIIDVDVIVFDDEIIETEKLHIPHPLMQNRNFVLLPMQDLKLDWKHPVFQKTISELISVSPDDSVCTVVQDLKCPLNEIPLQKFNYIAFEGNIGAGKTTLVHKIAEDFNAKTVLERFADNPFLPKFYKDQNRYAFPLEMSFLADRYQQLSDDLAQFDLFKDFIVADYHIFKSLIFAKITLQEDEYRLYRNLFDIIYKEMPKPDLYIYLYQNTDRLLQNIKKRGRTYEQNIEAQYLDKINNGYLEYIKSQKDLNVLIIDVSDRDFVKKQEDYLFVLNEIQKKLN
ncbi:2-amino-4-hydroxy-6-hydroxymethyldihydropteridine diphosphokinase [Flavobacterium johnsoniae]|jgi:2-amino-4-hydroxy-6-hydroxymethyldihydropteridine diphosphokinase|uniref:2-amino-4-hydroxy-6-hydroxymethyldihydropteridine pyrophosphokinase n=1 Tax=Flavobacterium johnsoniae (strain ATCC 17061 / DSM 2064 / JCM 8514 / BCRC 14874 / CCUG 350202 / NBRC 14942 / NCIMB 11054 / UW101) TaxID=376686 RepID=A5FJ71_FLAJ1|nr:2-amino-4-hydroxy-6-hydroxymethyldihydropteridine diphosphokinase [Flavobacterium johnsoniae]ABQ04751.1 2-amino-4-hydroxy-6-hydroxymethyldihydropteridine pyrophosphokinase [Flavobacterium johnsoniae UW101]OXE96407.1 2-amino-4-hydroxy-6-hydroxymethyldihydropteridine diphosphokinase [Flavobacterium johnsoniae UW101]WQG83451.1 2-amino-4-hydroxy-6-hydroxymethyldihydropteridine diphosphokinase [Flavobacterium johnsoniae UW101]SHK32477.1 2-amino-4-hydroxy-6-hydroxymethyldihydropteridinediphosphoki